MTAHALAIVEAAATEAQSAPITPTPAIRLALSWLAMQGIADPWQVALFWKSLTRPPERPDEPQAGYNRRRDLFICVEAWKRRAKE